MDFTGHGMELNNGSRQPHGTAVAEIVYNMAPEADLYLLHVANLSSLQEAVDYCVKNDVKVISHSVAWWNESLYDGGGNVSKIAAGARDRGILWINSAGNSAQTHYRGVFSDPDQDGWHNFDGDDETINIHLAKGAPIRIFLTWSAWRKLDGDYKIYLFDSNLDVPVAKSPDRTEKDTFPTAVLDTTVGDAGIYHIAIRRISGSHNHLLELFVDAETVLDEYQVQDHSMVDPAVSEAVTAAGAVSRSAWQAGPTEPFSSQGPTNGGLIKPDICGPDGVDTSIYARGFDGTSAAAPHVAGAAALFWSRFPDSTATDIRVMLEANTRMYAEDFRDDFCGSGFLNLPADIARPSIKLVSAVRILEPGPYYAGQAVTAQFTIQNVGTGCIFLGALTLGGRAQDNSVIDFPWQRDLILCAGDQYTYTAVLKLPGTGNYHFFATYKSADGVWNTSLSGVGPANTIDISVVAAPMVLMGIDGNQGNDRASLLRIDRRTGVASVVGQTPVLNINDIAFTPDGALYGVTGDQFIRINPLTGAAVAIGSLGFSSANGLVSDSAGRLYAGTFDGEFISVDPSTGQASFIGYFGSGLRMSGDLAFAPDGTLYGTARGSSSDQLIMVNVSTGHASVVGDIGFPSVFSLAFDQDGILLGGANGDTRSPRLIRINTNTGVGTLIGTITNANGLNGMSLGRDPQSWAFFRDDMEGDTSAWTAQTPWALTKEQAHSPAHAWSDSPGGNYADNVNGSIFTPMISLNSLNGATLRFWHRFDVEEGYDFCQVWITTDFGQTYNRLATFTGRSGGWIQSTIDLTQYVGAGSVFLAFQIISDSSTNGDGWYIDDIELVGAR